MKDLFNYVMFQYEVVKFNFDSKFSDQMCRWFYEFRAAHIYEEAHSVMLF